MRHLYNISWDCFEASYTGQLEGKNRFFEFLMSDVPGDTIAIETEPETYLSKLESDFAEPRTIHFQLMDEGRD